MSQHDASPQDPDGAGPAPEAGATPAPEPRTGRRRLSVWLAVPVVVALGAGGGYLAAETWAPADSPPATTSAGHGSHEAAPANAHDEAAPNLAEPAEHDTGSGHESSGGHEPSGGQVASGGHESSGAHDGPAEVDRPRAAVLAGFGAVNVAILLAAAALRRRRPRATRRPAAAPTA